MNRSRLCWIILLSLPFSTLFAQGPCQGIWQTTFGELRLRQVGTEVVGDYDKHGTIIGKYNASSGQVKGQFTYGNKKGHFTWTIKNGQLDGKWGYKNKPAKNQWTGKRVTAQTGEIKSHPWSGVWDTNYGQLRLLQRGGIVEGLYNKGDAKITKAEYNVRTKKLKGTFDNNGRKGNFEFTLSGLGTAQPSFKGKWAWGDATPKQAWNGKRVEHTESLSRSYLVVEDKTRDYHFELKNFCIQNHNEGWGDEEPFFMVFSFRCKMGADLEEGPVIKISSSTVQRTSKIKLRENNKVVPGIWLDNYEFRQGENKITFKDVGENEVVGIAAVFLEGDNRIFPRLKSSANRNRFHFELYYKEAFQFSGARSDYNSVQKAIREFKRDVLNRVFSENNVIPQGRSDDLIGRDFDHYINNPRFKYSYATGDRLRLHGKNSDGDHYFIEYVLEVE